MFALPQMMAMRSGSNIALRFASASLICLGGSITSAHIVRACVDAWGQLDFQCNDMGLP